MATIMNQILLASAGGPVGKFMEQVGLSQTSGTWFGIGGEGDEETAEDECYSIQRHFFRWMPEELS